MKHTELPTLTVGHRWYVRTPGKSEVLEAVIAGLTEKTVLLEIVQNDLAVFGIHAANDRKRFVKDEVKWIEQR